MKKLVLITSLISVLITSCESGLINKTQNQRYSVELDTSYKPNSIEIDRVTRTFYKNGDKLNGGMFMRHELGQLEYNLMIIDNDSKIGVHLMEKDSVNKFFDNISVVINNYDKNLRYYLFTGIIPTGIISRGFENKTATISLPNYNDKMVYFHNISLSEVDSMKYCFQRYLTENNI